MLITNIGTLVTNDPELGTLRDAAILFHEGRVAWVGTKPPEGAGNEPDRRGRPRADPGLRRLPRPPRVRGRPRGGVRRAHGGPPVHRGRDQDDGPGHPGRQRRGAEGQPRPAGPRGPALRHDDRRDQVRLRAHRARRGALTASRRRPRAHVPRRPRRPARARRRTPTPTSSRARCSTPARRTRPGSTCSARKARSTASRPGPSCRRGSPRASRPACTPTSSSTARASSSRSS